QVPVQFTTQGQVRGLQFQVQYDSSRISLTDVQAGADGNEFYIDHNLSTGIVLFANMNQNLEQGQKEIALLTFEIKDTASFVRTAVGLTGVIISDDDGRKI